MATQQDQQEPTDQQNQGCSSNYWVFLSTVFFFSSLLFLIRVIGSVSSGLSTKDDQTAFYVNLIGLIISFITLIVTILAWLFPGKILPDKLKKILSSTPSPRPTVKPKTPQKAKYFVSYHKSDYRLVRKEVIQPLKKEGRKKGFSIIYLSWSKRTKYSQEMARADKKAEYTLTILTLRYLDELQHDHAWIQEFRARNQPSSKDVAVLITEYERGIALESIEIINLTTEDKPADRVRMLLTLIPGTLETVPPVIPGMLEKNPLSFHNPEYLNMPYARNTLFTGRLDQLQVIRNRFDEDERNGLMRPQAIRGLSGMGKTQTAVEYAYKYGSRYRTILWIDVSICNDLHSIYEKISSMLANPENAKVEKQEDVTEAPESTTIKTLQKLNDVSLTTESTKKLLKEHERWLLVLDKCEDLDLAKNFIYPDGKGDILLTTRAHDIAPDPRPIIIEGLEPDEGALFLLRRIGRIGIDDTLDRASAKDKREAIEISETLGGFPLGLAHAGAYIEKSGESLSGYHHLYNTQLTRLFRELPDFDFSGSGFSTEGFKTIATTWSIIIRQLRDEKPNGPIAAELLRFCAFLSNDAVPEEIIKNAPNRGRILRDVAKADVFNVACMELTKYSLIDRSDKTLRVHRVMQAVIREGMIYGDSRDTNIRKLAERAIKAVNKALPDIKSPNWHRCHGNLSCALTCIDHIDKQRRQQILSCASTCIKYIEKWNLRSLEAMDLLYVTGHYCLIYANYAEAEHMLKKSLYIHEEVSNEEYPSRAKRYYTLAEVYRMQGKFVEADKQLQNAYVSPNLSEIDRVAMLNNTGRLYEDWGDWECWGEQARAEKYSMAEKYYKDALEIQKNMKKKEYLELAEAISWNELAGIYLKQTKNGDAQAKYDESEKNYLQALETFQKALGPHHPYTVQCRANLANLCIVRGDITRDKKACIIPNEGKEYVVDPERNYLEALQISEEFLGDGHPQIAARLANLAEFYRMQGRKREADERYKEALVIFNKLELGHPRRAYVMLGRAALLEEDESKEHVVRKLEIDAGEILKTHKINNPALLEQQNEPEIQAVEKVASELPRGN